MRVSPTMKSSSFRLLAISLAIFGSSLAQSSSEDGELVVSTTSTDTISSSAQSTAFSLSTDSAGSVSTVYLSSSSTSDDNSTTSTTSEQTRIILTGSAKPTTEIKIPISLNGTVSTSTPAEPLPTNTQPCNGHPEFCNRKYSNITHIAAHNSPFIKPNNVAANQDFDSLTQLNDGVRMLQIQVHYINSTLYLCHSDCSVLNMGTLENWLRGIAGWVYEHPYDVVTILIGNAKYTSATSFVPAIEDSGLKQFAYIPPKNPMSLDDWPTLGNMILQSQRVVLFLDYEARQNEVPYLLDQFVHIWETPFNPTSREFPCVIDRPPGLSERDAQFRMYMANHNLNTELTVLGNSLLVPTRPLLEETNAVNGTGSLGLAAEQCAQKWGRAPNWLLVDYYNVGNGSVFEVAAKWNNVTYDRECCGFDVNSAVLIRASALAWMGVALAVAFVMA